jgi:hypothetical protein
MGLGFDAGAAVGPGIVGLVRENMGLGFDAGAAVGSGFMG